MLPTTQRCQLLVLLPAILFLLHFLGLILQAQPEVLFEGTVAEGAPFKVKAAITDPSGFADFDDAPFELDFRCATVSTHLGSLSCHCVWALDANVTPI